MRKILRVATLLVAMTGVAVTAAARERAVRITSEQKANVAERIALATAIVDKHQGEAEAAGLAGGWRQATLESLLSLPLHRLREIEKAGTIEEVSAKIAEAPVHSNAIGSTNRDLVYRPITPCRYIDTRNAGGKISGTRGYHVGAAGSAYGGSGACWPMYLFSAGEDALGGVAMNVTIVGPTGAPGFAAVKPSASAPLVSVVNWYEAGPSVQVANQAIITTDQTSAADEFVIQTSSAVDVVVDLFGAFVAPEATAVQQNILYSSENLPNGSFGHVFSPPCPTGWKLTGGGYFVQASKSPFGSRPVKGESPAVISGIDAADRWLVDIYNDTGSQITTFSYAVCSRIPGAESVVFSQGR